MAITPEEERMYKQMVTPMANMALTTIEEIEDIVNDTETLLYGLLPELTREIERRRRLREEARRLRGEEEIPEEEKALIEYEEELIRLATEFTSTVWITLDDIRVYIGVIRDVVEASKTPRAVTREDFRDAIDAVRMLRGDSWSLYEYSLRVALETREDIIISYAMDVQDRALSIYSKASMLASILSTLITLVLGEWIEEAMLMYT